MDNLKIYFARKSTNNIQRDNLFAGYSNTVNLNLNPKAAPSLYSYLSCHTVFGLSQSSTAVLMSHKPEGGKKEM
jgi:hypothetical protein